jgi:hypothetical protein
MLSSDSGISSVDHQVSWFGVRFSLDYWVLVSLCCPLSLGKGQWSVNRLPVVSMLWWFGDSFSILHCHLTLDVAHWLRRWATWSTTFLISGSKLSPTSSQHFCLSSLCLLKVCAIISLPSPLLQCTFCNSAPLLCVSFHFLVFCSVIFLFGGS